MFCWQNSVVGRGVLLLAGDMRNWYAHEDNFHAVISAYLDGKVVYDSAHAWASRVPCVPHRDCIVGEADAIIQREGCCDIGGAGQWRGS